MHATAWVCWSEDNAVESLFFFHLYVGPRGQAQVTRLALHLHVLAHLAHPHSVTKSGSLTGTWGLIIRLGWLASANKSVHLSLPYQCCDHKDTHGQLFMWVLGSNDYGASASLTDESSYPSQGIAMDNSSSLNELLYQDLT